MTTQASLARVVLHPGDLYFGAGNCEVHTLLGSCISITLWHPILKLGGMCHFALPERLPGMVGELDELNGRYAPDCIQIFKNHIKKRGLLLSEFHAKIFGGGNIQNWETPAVLKKDQATIGERNSTAAFALLIAENVPVLVAHVGEFGYRKIVFELETGCVWVKFTSVKKDLRPKTLSGKS